MKYSKNSDGSISRVADLFEECCGSSEPHVVAASGVDEEAAAQASLSEEKDIQELLGDTDEAENSV